MADKSKKAKGGPDSKPAAKKAAAEDKAEPKKAEKAEPKALAREEHDDDHGHDAHGHAAGAAAHAHEHKPNIREYLVIFVVLAVLTAVEVGVAQVPGINKNLMRLSLVGLAFAKAAIVGLFYMHLKHETKIMKWTVALPVAAPAFYALVLISEAAWRLARW